jgi:hypothetical protein
MTDKEIISYIHRINSGKLNESIFCRPISKNVLLAKVWKSKPKLNSDRLESLSPYTFFFIKNKEGVCVSAVLDMNQDLHWVVLKKYRGQGFLTQSLQEVILPYICLRMDRDEQRITISKYDIGILNYQKSKEVALSVGFRPIDNEDKEFSINLLEQNYTSKFIQEENKKFELDYLDKLQNKFLIHYKNLEMLSNELEQHFGDDMMLSEHLKEIRSFKYKIEDIYYQLKE